MKRYQARIEGGVLVCPELQADLLRTEGYEVTVDIEVKDRHMRSSPQLRYLWGVVYEHIMVFYRGNISALLKDVIIAFRVTDTKEFIHNMLKAWFNKGISTSKLNHKQMGEYIQSIRDYYYHAHQLLIPEPEKLLGEDYVDRF